MHSSEPDDAALIRANFAALFDRHAPHIHRYLARRLGDQQADDLVAETFLTAPSATPTGWPPMSPRPRCATY